MAPLLAAAYTSPTGPLRSTARAALVYFLAFSAITLVTFPWLALMTYANLAPPGGLLAEIAAHGLPLTPDLLPRRDPGPGRADLDLAPNPGLWWYVFQLLFPEQHATLHTFLVYAPHAIALALHAGPLRPRAGDPVPEGPAMADCRAFAVVLQCCAIALFKAYPAAPHYLIWVALLPLFPAHCGEMPRLPLALFLAPWALVAIPALADLWVGRGGRLNSNFAYAGTLVWGGVQALVISEMAGALVKVARRARGAMRNPDLTARAHRPPPPPAGDAKKTR
jgi:hypothetical protein